MENTRQCSQGDSTGALQGLGLGGAKSKANFLSRAFYTWLVGICWNGSDCFAKKAAVQTGNYLPGLFPVRTAAYLAKQSNLFPHDCKVAS